MKHYVIYQGKVRETEYASNYGRSTTGEYYNFKDDFFPWVNGIFTPEKLKLNPICECRD